MYACTKLLSAANGDIFHETDITCLLLEGNYVTTEAPFMAIANMQFATKL
jgi:hypothetical protein